jgi:hypothetical protein
MAVSAGRRGRIADRLRAAREARGGDAVARWRPLLYHALWLEPGGRRIVVGRSGGETQGSGCDLKLQGDLVRRRLKRRGTQVHERGPVRVELRNEG